MIRERVILELESIRDLRNNNEIDEEQARESVCMIMQKFCDDIGFPDISMAIVEAWQSWNAPS